MVPLASADVVLVVWVDKVVDLLEVVDATLDKLQRVLPNDGIVLGAVDDEQMAFEVLGFVEQAVSLLAFWILLRGVHIALAVHNLIPLPIYDGAAGTAHLEHLGVRQLQGNGHESSEAPALNTHTVLVNIR